jgi:putative DNA primase/helicase
MKAAALWYARRGLRVIPTRPADPKRPLTPHGCRDATGDAEEIERLWRCHPRANVAVATGRASGAFVLDVDTKGLLDGRATLDALESVHGALPSTWSTATPSGGLHLWFRQPVRQLRNRVGFAPGLDVRTDGGSVVVPPSRWPDGRAYTWLRAPWDCPLADPPEWLLDLIAPPPLPRSAPPPIRAESLDRLARYAASAVNGECRELAATKTGGRNARLFQASARLGELVGAGLVPLALAEGELEAAAHDCGLAQEDGCRAVLATIKSGMARGMANPREVWP